MTRLVRDLMKIGVPTCDASTPLRQVSAILARENAEALVVMDEFGARGVVTQADLVRVYPRNYELLKAQDVMTEKIVGISPEAPVTAAANLMTDEKLHQVFLMHEHPGPSRPSAVLTLRAIVRDMAGLEPEKPDRPKLFAKQDGRS